MTTATKTIRVLVVDDSAFVRNTISKTLVADDDGIEIVGSARDGVEAVELCRVLKPDVVTMDITMPRMDGIAALRTIMAESPTRVLMVSALTGEQTKATIEALELGAVDFYLKPSFSKAAIGGDQDDLKTKVRMATQIPLSRLRPKRRSIGHDAPLRPAKRSRSGIPTNLVVIGSSTGGPRALADLVPALPSDLPVGYIIVQHMPAGFTRSLAERLNQSAKIDVKEAEDGDVIREGLALLAPGGYHLKLKNRGKIELSQEPLVLGVRPAVNVTMKSVADNYRGSVVGVVLTGMGADGTDGSADLKAAGARILAEDESTCAVYGMPKSVIEAGYAHKIVKLPGMAEEIVNLCSK